MMIHAYREIYLSNAQANLGEAFDYAINTCQIPGNDFMKLFAASSMSKRMENGEPACLTGKSGIEIAVDVLTETTGMEPQLDPPIRLERSVEYWIGWALAYYQWYSGRTYGDIFKAFSFEELERMYYPLHEADISKFADIADSRMKECFPETSLKRFRTLYGCSQAKLAELSGVGLRSIQMYEQRKKDINKASAEALYCLSRVLGCTMEDLLER